MGKAGLHSKSEINIEAIPVGEVLPITDLFLNHRSRQNGPTQAAKRATRAPQGDSFRLRRSFGSASARIISPAMTIISRSVTSTYKRGERTGCPITLALGNSPRGPAVGLLPLSVASVNQASPTTFADGPTVRPSGLAAVRYPCFEFIRRPHWGPKVESLSECPQIALKTRHGTVRNRGRTANQRENPNPCHLRS